MKPLCIDIYCGLGGWAEGFLAEGWDVIGFDIEQHVYGDARYPGMLCVQDAMTLHGSQFKHADALVMSPPCQEYSYMAMPWSLAKAKAAAIRADETGEKLRQLTALFDNCFRIQREACEAAGRHIPMVVENVRGAIPWVGRARWNYGSYYLWGDVPALMPPMIAAQKFNPDGTNHGPGSWFAIADSKNRGQKTTGSAKGTKVAAIDFNTFKQTGQTSPGFNVTAAQRFRAGEDVAAEGRKGEGAGAEWFDRNLCSQSSKSNSRKAASAMIAKIPLPLSRHIAQVFRP